MKLRIWKHAAAQAVIVQNIDAVELHGNVVYFRVREGFSETDRVVFKTTWPDHLATNDALAVPFFRFEVQR